MKKLLLTAALLAISVAARAGIYYDLQQTASSATMKLGGVMQLGTATNVAPNITLDGVTGNITANNIVGPAAGVVLTPQMYGAKANCIGLVDDYAAIQAAVNACGPVSGARCKLYFPSGCYYTTNTIEISSKAFISIEGAGRFQSYIYNVGGSSGAIHVNANNSLTAPNTLNNLGVLELSKIALGSTVGASLYLEGASNNVIHDAGLYLANATSYLLINGGSDNQFSNMLMDYGNTTIGPDPNGYFGTLLNSTPQPAHDITIESIRNPGIIASENSFVNIRTGCQITGDAVSVINSTTTGPSMAEEFFTNAMIKAPAGKAGWYVDGAQVVVDNSYFESCTSVTNAFYVASSSQPGLVQVNNLTSGGNFEINTKSNGGTSANSYVQISNSQFSQLIIDSAPYFLSGINTPFYGAAPGGAGKVTDATILHWYGMNNAGTNGSNQTLTLTSAPFVTNGITGGFFSYGNRGFNTQDATGNLWNFGSNNGDMLFTESSVNTNALVIKKTTSFVGLNTGTPGTQLDVNGNFQWGSGATKSTGTSSGNLTTAGSVTVGTSLAVDGSTFTVGTNGIVGAPSQPHACVQMNQQRAITVAQNKTFWDLSTINTQGMWAVSPDSGTITIPTGGGGNYHVNATIPLTKSASGTYAEIDIAVNGSRKCTQSPGWLQSSSANASNQPSVECDLALNAGDAVTVKIGSDNGTLTTVNDQLSTLFCVRKY